MQKLLAQLVQPQRSPQGQPHPHVAKAAASLQPHLVHTDRYGFRWRSRLFKQLPLLSTAGDLPGQYRRLRSPGSIQFTQMGDCLLRDSAPVWSGRGLERQLWLAAMYASPR